MDFDARLISAAISSREAWDKIAAHFDVDEFTPVPKFWIPLIAEWYANDPNAQSIDRSTLIERGKLRIKNPKQAEMLVEFVQGLPEPPSASNLVQTALEYKRFSVGMQLGAAIGQRDEARIGVLLDQFKDLRAATTLEAKASIKWKDAVVVEELFSKVGSENRIAVAPSKLNERIGGGALPGHHIIIFGRPEEGKSTLAINMAGSFVKRGIRTMYVGNEDEINVLKLRMLSRITGMTALEAEGDKEKAISAFRAAGGESHLLMTQVEGGTMAALEERVDEYRPQVLIVDQIRNLMTGTSVDSDMTRKLELLGIQMRNLLIHYGLIGISITQANDRTQTSSQRPPIFLGMGDMDSSRTGLPAQGDLIVGVGSDDDMKAKNLRALSFPKNKLSSGDNSHAPVIVTFDKLLSRVY